MNVESMAVLGENERFLMLKYKKKVNRILLTFYDLYLPSVENMLPSYLLRDIL